MEIMAWTDGSCNNNGKKHATGGYAVLMENKLYSGRVRSQEYKIDNGKLVSTDKEVSVTNIRAELLAIAVCLFKITPGKNLTIVTDSEFSIKAITTWLPSWKIRGYLDTEKKKNMDLFKIIDNLLEKVKSLKFIFQKSHVKTPTTLNEINNDIVDKKAKEAALYENYKLRLDLISF